MKTKKNVNNIKNNSTRKKKFYGADEYVSYSVHKVTLISYNPEASCKTMINLFGKDISSCQSPPDPALKKRGIRWVRFLHGKKAEFHFVPPFDLNHDSMLKQLIKEQKNIDPLETQLFENHVGIYVPDLTPVVMNALKHDVKCHLNIRADGMYQFYIQIDGCLDYLDIDSVNFDLNKIHRKYPNFHVYTFEENIVLVNKYVKKNKKQKTNLYFDPNHNAPREVNVNKDGDIKIIGKDTPKGKMWKITGKLDKQNNAILDFSSKGGPKNIKAKFLKDKIKFDDGNSWSLIYKIHKNK